MASLLTKLMAEGIIKPLTPACREAVEAYAREQLANVNRVPAMLQTREAVSDHLAAMEDEAERRMELDAIRKAEAEGAEFVITSPTGESRTFRIITNNFGARVLALAVGGGMEVIGDFGVDKTLYPHSNDPKSMPSRLCRLFQSLVTEGERSAYYVKGARLAVMA